MLQVVCAAVENADIPLRRSEKSALNEVNKKAWQSSKAQPGSSFAVTEESGGSKLKQRLQQPWEKCFVLVGPSAAQPR